MAGFQFCQIMLFNILLWFVLIVTLNKCNPKEKKNEDKLTLKFSIFNFWSQTLCVPPLHSWRTSCFLPRASIPDENHTQSWVIIFPFLSLLICLPALRCVSFNPLTFSSASFTNYNHLCTLTQPRMKMLCQLALWGAGRERGGGGGGWREEKDKKIVRDNWGSCDSSSPRSWAGDEKYLLFSIQ